MSRQEAVLVAPQRPAPQALCVEIHGNGQVSRALQRRLAQNDVSIASIHDSRGPVHVPASLVAPSDAQPNVLVDCTTPRYDGPAAERWIAFLESRLAAGVSVATCNKAPLALAWSRLIAAAARGNARLNIAATVGGGTPILATLESILRAHGLVRVEGGLSGTLAFVVRRVAEGGRLDEAVREAQRLGLAEPDPTLDLDGTDAQAKAVILHNRLFPAAPPLHLDHVRFPLRLDAQEIHGLARQGRVPSVVATVEAGWAEVRLQAPPAGRVVAFPDGAAWVRAKTADGGTFHLAGPGAGPEVTAGLLAADVLGLTAGARQS